MAEASAQPFIDRWKNSGAAERANYQLFLSELCDVLGVQRPDPTKPDDTENEYVFERSVTFHYPDGSTSTGRIDLYKRGCFILEAKQGVEQRERELALFRGRQSESQGSQERHRDTRQRLVGRSHAEGLRPSRAVRPCPPVQ